MCGLAGWVDFRHDLLGHEPTIRRMTETLAHRGPDAEGFWLARHAALGHRRLAVIDVEGGKQPMVHREDGRDIACLCHTGEVYNFTDLRNELTARGHRFLTRSDSEVVLR